MKIPHSLALRQVLSRRRDRFAIAEPRWSAGESAINVFSGSARTSARAHAGHQSTYAVILKALE